MCCNIIWNALRIWNICLGLHSRFYITHWINFCFTSEILYEINVVVELNLVLRRGDQEAIPVLRLTLTRFYFRHWINFCFTSEILYEMSVVSELTLLRRRDDQDGIPGQYAGVTRTIICSLIHLLKRSPQDHFTLKTLLETLNSILHYYFLVKKPW